MYSPPSCTTRVIRSVVACSVVACASNLKGQSALTQRSNGPFAPPRDWDALRRAYEAYTGELVDLAAENNITEKTLRRYAKDKEWVRCGSTKPVATPDPLPVTVDSAIAALECATDPVVVVPFHFTAEMRAELFRRVYALVLRKFDQLEICMSTDETIPTADHERETRIIGTLLRSVELADDVNRAGGAAPNSSNAAKSGAKPEDRRIDPEHLRRELAARIHKLRERRPS